MGDSDSNNYAVARERRRVSYQVVDTSSRYELPSVGILQTLKAEKADKNVTQLVKCAIRGREFGNVVALSQTARNEYLRKQINLTALRSRW